MAKEEDKKKTVGIGEFCCKNCFVRFQIFHLKKHIERSKSRIETLEYAPDSLIFHLVRHLTIETRTLQSVEEDLLANTQVADKSLRGRLRRHAGSKVAANRTT